MERRQVVQILRYVADHAGCTADDVLAELYPDAERYRNHVLAHLFYSPYYTQDWECYTLLTDDEYKVLNSSQPNITLPCLERKYGDIETTWSALVYDTITDIYNIARLVTDNNLVSMHDYTGAADVLNGWSDIYNDKYIGDLFDALPAKPDTTYDFEKACFSDPVLAELVSNVQIDMDECKLGTSSTMYDLWNRRMLRLADQRWGGHSVALDSAEEIA